MLKALPDLHGRRNVLAPNLLKKISQAYSPEMALFAGSSEGCGSQWQDAIDAACFFLAPETAPLTYWPTQGLMLPSNLGMEKHCSDAPRDGNLAIPLTALQTWIKAMPRVFERLLFRA